MTCAFLVLVVTKGLELLVAPLGHSLAGKKYIFRYYTARLVVAVGVSH